VTIRINIGADDNFLADGALDGKLPAVYLRLNAFDDDSGRQSIRQMLHRFKHHYEIPLADAESRAHFNPKGGKWSAKRANDAKNGRTGAPTTGRSIRRCRLVPSPCLSVSLLV
jgi:hypothetical protein